MTDPEFAAHLIRVCEQSLALWAFLDAMEES